MLHTVTALERMSLQAIDGNIGMVNDTYFDGHAWMLRYFVGNTGSWLAGRSVLVSPLSITSIDWPKFTVVLNLTREQIARNRGVSDGGSALRQRLQSTGIVTGYSIEAVDGPIGYAQDFLYDGRAWALRFVAVDARSWWPGRHVLIAIQWVEYVHWNECRFRLNLRQDEVREAPEWYPELAPTPHSEDAIYRYGAQSPGANHRSAGICAERSDVAHAAEPCPEYRSLRLRYRRSWSMRCIDTNAVRNGTAVDLVRQPISKRRRSEAAVTQQLTFRGG